MTETSENKTYVCTAGKLNVRAGASTAYRIVGAFKLGDLIYSVAKVENGWIKCKIWNGSYGYVSGSWAKEKSTTNTTPNPEPIATSTFTYSYKNGCHIVNIDPKLLNFKEVDKTKKSISLKNYFNAGFFGKLKGGSTCPACNMAGDGIVYYKSATLPSWINVAGKSLSTLCVLKTGQAYITKTKDMNITNIFCGMSGVPIIDSNGNIVPVAYKSEGYDGSELYNTWHSFLTCDNDKVQIIYAKVGGVSSMGKLIKSLGYGKHGCIKLDGGGSAILVVNGIVKLATSENRRINTIGTF